MADFNDVFNDLKKSVADMAVQQGTAYAQQAQQDGHAFLDSIKADLQLWTQQLASGDLSKDDFEVLVRGKKSLAKMEALAQAGMAAAQIDQFRTAVVGLAVNAACKFI